MVKTILINTTHCSNSSGNKNEYTYKFLGGGLELPADKKNSLAISSITIPYSFFNVSDIYNNRNYQFIYNSVTYNVNLPASFMTVDDINKHFQYFCIANNLYTLDSYGNYVYYMEFTYNVGRYAVEVLFYPCVLTAGGSNPQSMILNGLCMQLVISQANANFGQLIGLSPGTYGGGGSTTSVLSNITVQGSPIQALNLTCNIVNNSISTSPNSFYCFTPSNTSFGSNITLVAPELVWIDVFPSRYSQIILKILDQEGRDVQMKDSSVCLMLCLKTED